MVRRTEGWQTQYEADRVASRNPIPPYKGGGGFVHVPGQIGTYAQYLRMGGPEKGVGSARILGGGRMAAYRAGVRLAGSPIRAPITYTSIEAGPPVFVPTGSLEGGERFLPLAGSPALSFGSAATGLAAGGSALARGGPAVGTVPGGGLGIATGLGAGGGLTAGLGAGGIGGSITTAGSGIINIVKQYLPLAAKVIIAVIVIKIVLWLIKGRRR